MSLLAPLLKGLGVGGGVGGVQKIKVGGRMPLFLFIFHICFTYIRTFIQSHSYNTFIHRHSLGPLSISSSLESSVGRPSLWCRAENRTRACLTRYLLSHATPYWATQHHTEPRRTILSHATPYWATPHHTELLRTVRKMPSMHCICRFAGLNIMCTQSFAWIKGRALVINVFKVFNILVYFLRAR